MTFSLRYTMMTTGQASPDLIAYWLSGAERAQLTTRNPHGQNRSSRGGAFAREE